MSPFRGSRTIVTSRLRLRPLQGYASEVARALVDWLRQHGVDEVVAHIHPEHEASAVVARRAGLVPTGRRAGGEQIWSLQRAPGRD